MKAHYDRDRHVRAETVSKSGGSAIKTSTRSHQDLSTQSLSGAGIQRAETQNFEGTVGGDPIAVQVTRSPETNPALGKRLSGLGLTFAVGAVTIGTVAEQLKAVVVSAAPGADAAAVTKGIASSNAGTFGALEGEHQSGKKFHASLTMLTDFNGQQFQIAAAPVGSGVTFSLGGVGKFGVANGAMIDQDGQPREGDGRTTLNMPLGVNSSYFFASGFAPQFNGNSNVGGLPGDSGGRAGTADGKAVYGLISGGTNGTSIGAVTLVSRFDTIESWIDEQISSKPGIWGATGTHVTVDNLDPVTLNLAEFGANYDNPLLTYRITDVISYPGSSSSWQGVDFNHSDVTLIRMDVLPDPSGVVMFLPAAAGVALGRPRRRQK